MIAYNHNILCLEFIQSTIFICSINQENKEGKAALSKSRYVRAETRSFNNGEQC